VTACLGKDMQAHPLSSAANKEGAAHELRVSHETIYNCIYAQPVGELRKNSLRLNKFDIPAAGSFEKPDRRDSRASVFGEHRLAFYKRGLGSLVLPPPLNAEEYVRDSFPLHRWRIPERRGPQDAGRHQSCHPRSAGTAAPRLSSRTGSRPHRRG